MIVETKAFVRLQQIRLKTKVRNWSIAVNFAAAFLAGIAVLGCGGPAPASAPKHGIVTLAPNHTETVFALGQSARVVGVSSYCDYPPEVTALPRLGGYFDPELEKIALLRPEMIILPGESPKVTQFAAMKGIQVLNVNMDSLKTIDQGIETIGKALGCEDKAAALRQRIKDELDAVRKAVAGKPRPKVLILHTRTNHDFNSLQTAGGTSFVSELIDVAGGENIFKDNPKNYLEASKESIVVQAPDVIVEFHAGETLSEAEKAAFVADWKEFGTLPAVKNNRIYLFMDSYGLRPGPRVSLTARRLASFLHPDVTLPAS
ncbi:MAG: ABC transporter substrate-binding protein [Candidatus Hydrogenedentes bacterium]|nr:ABC transporter substrate-binding protein [Candidatus Hydrogenedentota bacterium]